MTLTASRPAKVNPQAVAVRWHAGKPCACGARTSAFGSVHDAYAGRNGLSVDKWGEFVATCTCGAVRRVKAVRGVFSAKHKCSAKCLSATGHDCECECGGKNHGAGATP